jgi:hypothetical protein
VTTTESKSGLAGAYEAVFRPDRPPGADRDRRPSVAAALSLLLAGAGQLYNRQLFKALVIMGVVYLIGGTLLIAWAVLHAFLPETGDGWGIATGRFFLRLGSVVPIIAGGLWLFAVLDAGLTAARLRAGKIVVRYSFRKQAAMAAASLVPGAGMFVPKETCPASELVEFDPTRFAQDFAKKMVLGKILSLAKIGLAVIGLTPLIIGASIGSPAWLVSGAVVVLIGLILFLM